jgi:hypothetical protein
MHNELRYQAKTHAISEKLSKEKKKKNNKDIFMEKEMTSIPSM